MNSSFAEGFLRSGLSDGTDALPGELAARFDILERLAHGEQGETWLLSEKPGGKKYVYKTCPGGGAANEAELLRGLDHKGLPRFEDVSEAGGGAFALREYVEGVPLDEYMAGKPLDRRQAVEIARGLCDILSYLHTRPVPIIHRDVKPSNIIIGAGGGVTLIDFGISRRYAESAEADTVSFGTRLFAPPEQYGFAQTDCRADIYALGVVLRYMLTGDIGGEVEDRALARVVRKCTAFSPDSRYRSAAAVKRALGRCANRGLAKAARAAACVLALCVSFAAGAAAERYTGIFGGERGEGLAGGAALPSGANLQNGAASEASPAARQGETDGTGETDATSGTSGAGGLPLSPVPKPTAVVFSEPLIAQAARQMLGKADGEAIYPAELAMVTGIYIVGNEIAPSREEYEEMRRAYAESETPPRGTIASLSDIEMMPNIESLYILGQPLWDVSPLSSCEWLKSIELAHCGVEDASALAALPRLESLVLFDNDLRDFSCFAQMKALRELSIGNMPVYGLSQLGDAHRLEKLSLHNTPIASLEGIERLPSLQSLIIVGTDVKDFSPLNALPELAMLEIDPGMERYLGTLARRDIEVRVWGEPRTPPPPEINK